MCGICQVLAMCFVRKGLDYIFTRHELKWLDDIIPESHKREKEEKKKRLLACAVGLFAEVRTTFDQCCCPKVLVLEDPRGPIYKSLSLSLFFDHKVLENFQGHSANCPLCMIM